MVWLTIKNQKIFIECMVPSSKTRKCVKEEINALVIIDVNPFYFLTMVLDCLTLPNNMIS